MIHPQAIHMVLSAGEKGAASLISLLFVGVAHSLLAIAAGPAANPHGPSQGFDSPAAGFFTALSKSLSNSRSCTTLYFSNSLSACVWASFAEIVQIGRAHV